MYIPAAKPIKLEDQPPPRKIYLQWSGSSAETTWCQDRVNDDDIVYYRRTNKAKTSKPKIITRVGKARHG